MKINVIESKVVFPANIANILIAKSKHRNALYKVSRFFAHFGSMILIIIMLVCGTVMKLPPFEGTASIVFFSTLISSVLAILIFIIMIINKFDFRECTDDEYVEIESLKLLYPELREYIQAISDTGRNFISNYDNEAIIRFHRKKRMQDKEKTELEKLIAARKKVFSL